MQISGRAWVFGREINTDLIYPQDAFRVSLDEATRLVFSANRPGWAEQVKPGDIIVAGERFGTGSSRPASALLLRLGIAAVVASSFSELFFRNAVNVGLPVLNCPGVDQVVREGDEVRLDLGAGSCTVPARDLVLKGGSLPPYVLAIITGGGVLPSLEQRGLVRSLGERLYTKTIDRI